MGADIHVFLLKRNETGGFDQLKLYTKNLETGEFGDAFVGEGRNYTLFSKLAGVRGAEDEISCGYSGFVPGCPQEIIDEYYDYGHTPKYFAWDALTYCAKIEGMTKYVTDTYEMPEYNVVEDWLNELRVVLEAYTYSTKEVYIQIFFDN